MQLNAQIRINAPRAQVFAALNDVAILKQAIPGCEQISALSPTEFAATVAAKIGPLKARFAGSVQLTDIVAPESYTLSGEGKGGPAGHARISSHVRLTADGDATLLDYDVKADIGGKLAQLGGALVQKTAQKLAAEFFHNFEALLNSTAGPAAGTALTGSEATVVANTVAPAAGNGSWWWLAAAAVAIVVVGALVR